MHESIQKEDINIGYIYALCASVGVDYEIVRHDEDSTDGILKKKILLPDDKYYNSELRIQLKATSSTRQYQDKGKYITYKLKAKNYNDLCARGTSPIVLGLLVLSKDDVSECVHWTKEELLIRGCMYWGDFSDEEQTNNESTKTVCIDKNHVLNKESLIEILEKIAREEW